MPGVMASGRSPSAGTSTTRRMASAPSRSRQRVRRSAPAARRPRSPHRMPAPAPGPRRRIRSAGAGPPRARRSPRRSRPDRPGEQRSGIVRHDALPEAPGIGGDDGHAGGHGLECHETARLGAGREDAQVSARVERREVLNGQESQEPHERQPRRDATRHRTLARDHESRPLPHHPVGVVPGRNQHIEVLLRCEPADMEHDHGVVAPCEPAAPAVVTATRMEQLRVHPAPPHGDLRDAASLQLRSSGRPRRQRLLGGAVEPREPTPHRRLEQADAVVAAVLGEVRVERGDQWHTALQRVAAAREPQWTFGMDVDHVRSECVEEVGDRPGVGEGQPDGGVQRERNRQDPQLPLVIRRMELGIARGQDRCLVAARAEQRDDAPNHRRHPVHLGEVCVCRDADSHRGRMWLAGQAQATAVLRIGNTAWGK